MIRPARRAPSGRAGIAAAFAAYDAAMSLLVAAVLSPVERLRVAARRSCRPFLDERLGRWRLSPGACVDRPLLVHAVSAGEVAAAARLIAEITERAPRLEIVLTTGNREGRTAAESLKRRLPSIVAVSFLPWDRRRAVRTWLQTINPCAVVVVETEIWPALFRGAEKLGIPLFLVSGRIESGDASRYRLATPFFRRVLSACAWIGVQSESDRNTFLGIGAPSERLAVAGNLKHDRHPLQPELPEPWRAALDAAADNSELVVAGSTHHPEELWLFDALRRLRTRRRQTRLIVAPRHPGRAMRVLKSARRAGLRGVLWSAAATTDWEVLVVDRIGPLAALYRHADVAVIGGSLATGGGHNPLEAAAAARPVLIGRAHERVRDLVDGLQQAGGIRVLAAEGDPPNALVHTLAELLDDPESRRVMGEKAAGHCLSLHGAAARYAEIILSRIASSDRASRGTARDSS